MSTQPPVATELAKQFIDDIIRISAEHGMRTVASEDTYKQAVRSAARAYRSSRGSSRREEPLPR